jgi:hypothetical protein
MRETLTPGRQRESHVMQLTKFKNLDTLEGSILQTNIESPEMNTMINSKENLIPEVRQRDIDILMTKQEMNADQLLASEELTAIWISSYLDEINRVESFFNAKLEELINQFILMQDKFRLKSELYETEKSAKKQKELKKQKQPTSNEDQKQALFNIIQTRISQPGLNGSSRVSDAVKTNEEEDAYGLLSNTK